MEILALVVALLGLFVVFETPRNWIARLFQRATGTKPKHQLARAEPISIQSVVLFISTDVKSLALDQEIADASNTTVAPFVGDGKWLTDKVGALGVSNIGQLQELLGRHAKHACMLAHAFAERPAVSRGHGLDLALQMEAMQRYGSDWHGKFIAPL